MRRYEQRQAHKEEQREKAFERVFNDPDVDLEEVAAQVRHACMHTGEHCPNALCPLEACFPSSNIGTLFGLSAPA